ncbi:MAG TPA: hypothetical protein VL527_02815, partial [Dongiaceae bacterium]|nr:hypothetical protein [Dongiaceae bacterium]
ALYNVTGAETFNNAGTLRKSGGPGTTTIGPQVNNAPTGVVEAQVGTLSLTGGGVLGSGSLRCGITSLGSYGRINFPGTVTLSGTIGAVLLGSFVPPINSTFSLVTCASHTGAFASLALPPVAIWATNYTATSFTVTVTSLNNLAPTQSGQWTGNGFVLSLNGPNDLGTNIVYASTNLQNWAPIYTNPPTNGIIQFLDTDSKKFRMRFYRTAEQ